MSNTNKLKLLLNLIGTEENYSCSVSINTKLDGNVLEELNNLQKACAAQDTTVTHTILQNELQCPRISTNEPTIWTYAVFVFEILLQIDKELEAHDELPIPVNDAKKLHIGIRKCIEYGLKPFLLGNATPIDSRLPYIITCIKVLMKLVNNKFFPFVCTQSDQHLVYTDLLSSIFTIIGNANDVIKLQFEDYLLGIQSKLKHSDYFKILFLIMGSGKNRSGLCIQHIVHTQLKQSLYRSGSFKALCEALLPSITSLDQDEEIVKKRLHSCTVISSIVAQKGHGKQFYTQIIQEIHEHLLSYIQSNKSHQLFFADVGVRCLSRLWSLQSTFIQNRLFDILLGTFNNLAKPCDLLAGAVVCDAKIFVEAIHLVHLTFCAAGPSDDTMPSQLLTPFMPLFFQIHHRLTESRNKSLKNEILAIIVRCLSNRDKSEIKQIVECVLYEEYDEHIKYLHPRLQLNIEHTNNDENERFTFKIATSEIYKNSIVDEFDINTFLQPSVSMVNVLKQCNHNILVYNIFLNLLQMFSHILTSSKEEDSQSSSSELLGSEEELNKAIEFKFKRKYAVIHALNELILFKPFHGQFTENPHNIMTVLDKMLYQQMEQIAEHRSDQKRLSDDTEEMLIVILLCVGEFMSLVKNDDLKAKLERTLNKVRAQMQSDRIKNNGAWNAVLKKLDILLDSDTNVSENSEFLKIKAILCETSSEPYTKVYGIMSMIKLIEAKDSETCSNAHIVLVLAMKLLREEDSYIFLNCIKLLIALFDILEGTVLETLIAEYHFDIDSDAADIDFKLKAGETIVKVIQGLGEMCYKFKEMLINCFLRGAYNQNDEFRTSNISTLGVVLRTLSYQVHHFFQEVVLLTQNTLMYDKYLPARRASALVLTDLIKGMQSLEQYQDFLLPIYRNLNYIAENDSDLHVKIHARNGLECLKEKVKEALTIDTKMEKEIRIFDVKEKNHSMQYK